MGYYQMRIPFFPLYSFTFKKHKYLLSDLHVLKEKCTLRLEYPTQIGYSTYIAEIEYPCQKMEEDTKNGIRSKTHLLKRSGISYKLTVLSPDQNSKEPNEEVMFDFYLDHYNLPYISKAVILNHKTLRNFHQLQQKKTNVLISKRMKNCLPIKWYLNRGKK